MLGFSYYCYGYNKAMSRRSCITGRSLSNKSSRRNVISISRWNRNSEPVSQVIQNKIKISRHRSRAVYTCTKLFLPRSTKHLRSTLEKILRIRDLICQPSERISCHKGNLRDRGVSRLECCNHFAPLTQVDWMLQYFYCAHLRIAFQKLDSSSRP